MSDSKAPLPRPVALGALTASERERIIERAPRSGDDGSEQRALIEATVLAIIQEVQARGDEALLAYTQRFDKVRPDPLVYGPREFHAALDATPEPLAVAMERAARNLKRVAERTRPSVETRIEVEPGLTVTERHEPLGRVGCYAPGGRAAYPSSVIMTVVPARTAGVPEIMVASPPGPDGAPHPSVLAACAIAGATSCLAAGGAQAIAALASGTMSVPRVDKIVGPGNAYVTAAKRLVSDRVGIDMPAGPSEVIILADQSADPHWVALDLIAQAEHGPDSPCLLVTTSQRLADAVADLLPQVLAGNARGDIAAAALTEHGEILVARDHREAAGFVTAYAPEHLQVMARDADAWADNARHAGTTFIGPWAPVPAGDYLTGANHVLPTRGAARWVGPLGVADFLVRRTRQTLRPEAARALIGDLGVFARAEGLSGHADAMRARRTDPTPLGPQRSDGGDA